MSVHTDFTQNVWLPARLVTMGANPYHPTDAQVAAALGEYISQFSGTVRFNSGAHFNFIYPVWMALFFSPFASLPLATATAVWRALNILLLVWGVGSVLRSTNPVFRTTKPAALAAIGMAVLLTLIFRESFLTLYVGQFSIIEFGILAAIWGWLAGSHSMAANKRLTGDILTGVGLALLATKPQAVGLAVLLIALWAITRRRYIIPASAAAALALLLFVPMLAFPWSLRDWFSVVAGGQASSQATVSASVWGVSYQLLGSTPVWLPLALLLTGVGLALLVPRWLSDLRDKRSAMPLSLLLTLCVNSVISPYMLGYEHVVLLLPVLVLLAAAGLPGGAPEPKAERNNKRWRLALYSWLAVLPFLVVAVQAGLNGKEYPAVAQSLAILAICLVTPLVWQSRNMANRLTKHLPEGKAWQ